MAQFTDISSPLLDLTTAPLRDSSLEEVNWLEYTPQNPSARTNIELVVNNTDQYTLPCEGYLQITGRLVKTTAVAAYATNSVIGLVNNGIMSLFSDAGYWINGQPIEVINNNLGIATTILGLVRYSSNYAESAGSSLFWARDTSGEPDIAPYTLDAGKVTGDNPQYNRGFHTRQKLLFSGGNTGHFEAIIPLSHIFGFCRNVRKIFYGVKHEIRLQRTATDDDAIYRPAATADAGTVNINKCSLWMRIVRPSLEWTQRLEAWISNNQTTTLYWQATQVDAKADEKSDFSWKVATRGSDRPHHVFVAFQLEVRRNSQTTNSMIFDALALSSIHLTLNGVRVPLGDLDLNFAERRFHRAYKMLSDYMGKDQNVDTGFQVSTELFRTIYPINHFDLEAQSERLNDSVIDIYVHARFSAAPGNYRAYAVIQSDRTMILSGGDRKMNITSSS